MSKNIPEKAKVVIVGGGIIGCSIAYHLTKLGWNDVVLLERKQLTCGTTWHAAGLLTTLRGTENATKLAKYTQDVLSELEAETGQATGFMRIGSIQVASNEAYLEEMRRGSNMARYFGVESQEIAPEQILDFWPMANVSDVSAGFHFPNDGRANPTDATMAYAKGAKSRGARIIEGVVVLDLVTKNKSITNVITDHGDIAADYVVNCAGMWARDLGKLAGVDIPLHAAEHYYLITEKLEGMHQNLPILRDPYNCAYYREETGKLMLGIFETEAAPWGQDGIPDDFCFDELPPDWERMMPYLEKAMQRIPSMENAGIQLLFNGPESFTPDHNYLMGKAPGLDNFYIAAGFNSLGILSSGGAGMVMAHWIAEGHPPMDVFDADIRRMHHFQNNPKYLHDRTVESLGIGYQNHWPYRQWETSRGVKKSPLHDRMAKQGACFGESAGWERPFWFAPQGVEPKYEYGFERQSWFQYWKEEHLAIRENVGMIEQGAFSKIMVEGRHAVDVMNRIACNNVDVPPGQVIYTQFLNERGTIEADLTISRLAEDQFLVLTAPFTHTHILNWIKDRISEGQHCFVSDVTSAYGMLNIQGPHSRALLQRVSETDFSNEAFPFGTCQNITIGYHTALAVRLTYVGELGWELYIPTEYLQQVYDLLVQEGTRFGLKHCGVHALGSLRLEKAYREWGHDVGGDDTLIEAGLSFTADLDKKNGFIGKEAFLAQKAKAIKEKRLVQFLLEDPEPLLFHNELIWVDGKLNSITTSAAYGHSLGAAVALGYVYHEEGVTPDFIANARFEIQVADKMYAAKASLRPFYDPKSLRVKV